MTSARAVVGTGDPPGGTGPAPGPADPAPDIAWDEVAGPPRSRRWIPALDPRNRLPPALNPRLRPRPGDDAEPRDPQGRATVPGSAFPLVRRRRSRERIGTDAAISAALHILLIVALLAFTVPKSRKGSPEPPTVEMIFGHNGSSGASGTPVPLAQQGSTPPPAVAPAPNPLQQPPQPEVQPEEQQAAPAAPAPSPPMETAPLAPPRPRPSPHTSRSRPASRSREARRATRSSNPFENLTNLSMEPSDDTTPPLPRRGRGGGGAAINLSLGPMVKGGRLSMPFSVRGAHGMTSDYMSMLDDWVERHKYYPQSAAQRGDDGDVTLHVTWDRSGHVLSVQMVSSSGDTDLDDAWQGVFRGATLPAPPPDVPGDPVQMDMVMHFILLH